MTTDQPREGRVEAYDSLILSVPGIDDPESDTFMRGFAYGRFTVLDSELARHWGVGRQFEAGCCPIVPEPANLLSRPRQEASGEVREIMRALAEAARSSCDASRFPELTEALADADAVISAQPLADAGDVERGKCEHSFDAINQWQTICQKCGVDLDDLPSTAPDELRAEGDVAKRARELAGYLVGLAKVYRAFPNAELWGRPDQAEHAAGLTDEAADLLRALARPDRMAEMEGLLGGDPQTWSHRVVMAVKARVESVKQRDLAAQMGVSEARVSQIMRDCPNWTIATVERLLMAAAAVQGEANQ